MMRNTLFWEKYFKNVFKPEIAILERYFLNKILPSFDDVLKEAEQIEKQLFQRLNEQCPADDDLDISDIGDMAQDKSIEHCKLMGGMKKEMLGVFYLLLYCLFERQLFYFYRKEILSIDEECRIKEIKWKDLLGRFKNQGISLGELKSYKGINILRCIVNIFKHRSHRAVRTLYKIEPSYFKRKIDFFCTFISEDPLDNLKISNADFIEQIKKITNFWSELGDSISKQVEHP